MKRILLTLNGLFLAGSFLFAADGDIPEPADTVRKLYTEHLVNKGPLLDPDQRETWEFRFGAELCAALKKEPWGFDPLIFAQDHEVSDLTVKEIERDDRGRVLVLVRFKNFGKVVRLVVALNHTDHGYAIANIVDPESGVDLINDL